MQRLEITNFSTIDHCEIDIHRFTILIGPQATGKSVIAKIAYFLKGLCSALFMSYILQNQSQEEFEKAILDKFEKLFPRNTWSKSPFSIEHRVGDYSIRIFSEIDKLENAKTKIVFSKSILLLLHNVKKTFTSQLIDISRDDEKIILPYFSQKVIPYAKTLYEHIRNDVTLQDVFNISIFIPASRSILFLVGNIIYTLINSGASFDNFLIEFGEIYERFKKKYDTHTEETRKIQSVLSKIINQVIKGVYVHEDGQDWIKSKQGKIRLSHASSGQQESLPMLIVLNELCRSSPSYGEYYAFIEEPEAHLFPFAQKSIVTLLSLIHSHAQAKIFITTHSPYILSAMNILITAHDALTDNNQEQIAAIIGDAAPIRFEDVAAYNVDNGGCTSILDHENRLIGVNIIDEVSDAFDAEFDKLLILLPTPA